MIEELKSKVKLSNLYARYSWSREKRAKASSASGAKQERPVWAFNAGDTFTGYFIAGYTEGMPVHEILRMASKAASVACTRMGAAGSIPLREEVERLLRTE